MEEDAVIFVIETGMQMCRGWQRRRSVGKRSARGRSAHGAWRNRGCLWLSLRRRARRIPRSGVDGGRCPQRRHRGATPAVGGAGGVCSGSTAGGRWARAGWRGSAICADGRGQGGQAGTCGRAVGERCGNIAGRARDAAGRWLGEVMRHWKGEPHGGMGRRTGSEGGVAT